MRDLSAPSAWGLSQTAAECAETKNIRSTPTRRNSTSVNCMHAQTAVHKQTAMHTAEIFQFQCKKKPPPT